MVRATTPEKNIMQQIEKITFIPRVSAKTFQSVEKSVLISVYDASEPQLIPEGNFEDILYLQFHDTDDQDGVLTSFNENHAKWIFSFLKRNAEAKELVVHCTMGVSRSAAIAIFFSEILGVQCYREGLKVNYQTWPMYNKLVYRVLCNYHDNNIMEGNDA